MKMYGFEKKAQWPNTWHERYWRLENQTKNSRWKKDRDSEWKIIGVGVCVRPWGIRTALCVVGISIMCEQNLWIPCTLLGTDSVIPVRAAHLCLGSFKHSVWALYSKSLCLGHTLSPLLSAISLFSPLRAMETRSLSLCSFLQLFSVSSSHYSIFVFITLVFTAIGLIRTGRVRRLLNWASRWLSRSWCVGVCVCVFGVCVCAGEYTWMLLCKWSKLCGTEIDKAKWAGIGCNSLPGLCGSCLPDPLHSDKTNKEVIKASVEPETMKLKVYSK